MRLRNSTDFSDAFLRRMCSWINGELGLPAAYVRAAQFTVCSHRYRGRAWRGSRRILVRIGRSSVEQPKIRILLNGQQVHAGQMERELFKKVCQAKRVETPEGVYTREDFVETVQLYPVECKYPGRVHAPSETLTDRIEALVHVTAHELAHHERWSSNVRRNHEAGVDGVSFAVLRAFRTKRERLLADWNRPTKEREQPVKQPTWIKRANATILSLEKWVCKLKLAQTKVRKLRAKVKYYDNRKAAMS